MLRNVLDIHCNTNLKVGGGDCMTALVNQVHSLLYFVLIVVIFASAYAYMLDELKDNSVRSKEDVIRKKRRAQVK